MATEIPESAQVAVIDRSQPQQIRVVDTAMEALGSSDLMVKFRAAPINPLDLAVLDGMYPVKPIRHVSDQPIPGYDGVAEVLQAGDGVSDISPGDLIIPSAHGLGTWCTRAVISRAQATRIEKPLDVSFAALLKGSVLPAYLLVEDMATLQPGEWIVQNAGTSVIAQFVAQFARLRGLHTLSVVRDRSLADMTAVRDALESAGADLVLSESEFVGGIGVGDKRLALGIDAVFGTRGKAIFSAICNGGTYVQLAFLNGPESRMEIGAKEMWARGLTMKGFRAAAQLARLTEDGRRRLLAELVDLFNAGHLRMPSGILRLRRVEWSHHDTSETEKRLMTALKAARDPQVGFGVKHVMVFGN